MILQLQPKEIVAFWPAIKHGICVANRLSFSRQQVFCNRILERLLAGKAQCWFGFNEKNGEKQVTAFGITTLEESSLGEVYLFLHTLYAFRTISTDLLEEILPKLELFANNTGCSKLVTFTSVARLKEYYSANNFTQDTTLWIKEL